MANVNIGSWLAEVGQYLGSQGAGTFGNTPTANIFVHRLPNTPTDAIALVSSGGPRSPVGVDPMNRTTMTVLVRKQTHVAALQQAQLVFNLLDNKWNILATVKGRCVPDHQPGPNFQSESGLPIYSLNFSWTLGVGG